MRGAPCPARRAGRSPERGCHRPGDEPSRGGPAAPAATPLTAAVAAAVVVWERKAPLAAPRPNPNPEPPAASPERPPLYRLTSGHNSSEVSILRHPGRVRGLGRRTWVSRRRPGGPGRRPAVAPRAPRGRPHAPGRRFSAPAPPRTNRRLRAGPFRSRTAPTARPRPREGPRACTSGRPGPFARKTRGSSSPRPKTATAATPARRSRPAGTGNFWRGSAAGAASCSSMSQPARRPANSSRRAGVGSGGGPPSARRARPSRRPARAACSSGNVSPRAGVATLPQQDVTARLRPAGRNAGHPERAVKFWDAGDRRAPGSRPACGPLDPAARLAYSPRGGTAALWGTYCCRNRLISREISPVAPGTRRSPV